MSLFNWFGRMLWCTTLIIYCFMLPAAHASVLITGTRIIYPMNNREVTVQLKNTGDKPSVIQSWIDGGDATQTPDTANVPFITTPPVTRIDGQRSQALRIAYLDGAQPKNKESVFWLNVLEIPASTKSDLSQAQQLRIAIRSRIKIFLRPDGLPGSSDSAPEKLTWQIIPGKSGKGWMLSCENPTAFYVSFNRIALVAGSKTTEVGGGMVAPGETAQFDLPALPEKPGVSTAKIDFNSINDYGGFDKHTSPVKP